MTPLRTQLRSARQAYRLARYPGDLANQLLPRASRAPKPSPRRWLLLGGVATTAAAAAVLLSLLMSRVSELPRPTRDEPSRGALVDWLPIQPEHVPLPRFELPSKLELPAKFELPSFQSIDRYRDLATPYLQQPLPNIDLPALPDFYEWPGRSVDWLRQRWDLMQSA